MKLNEFLTQKVNKDTLKKDSVQRAIKLTICIAFIVALIFQLVGCLFSPLSASAYYNDDALSAQVIVVDELPTTDIDDNAVYLISGSTEDYSIVGTWVFNDVISVDVFPDNSIVYIDFVANGSIYTGFYFNISYGGTPGTYLRYYDINNRLTGIAYSSNGLYGFPNGWNTSLQTITFDNGTITDNVTFINWLKANAVKQGDSGSGSTVTTYYVHYNDTWFDTDNISTAVTFLNYRVNNPSIVNTLDVLLDDYSGSFDSLVDMLNSRNYQEYEDLVLGIEQDAFDRGASSGFGENVLGSAFNAPLTALNQWVLFETSSGLEVTMGGVFTGLIALSVLIILLKMFSGG